MSGAADNAPLATLVDWPTHPRARLAAALQAHLADGQLAAVLETLFKQQLRSGYVLFDPVAGAASNQRLLPGKPGFLLQWNPDRELRKHYDLLVERGVIDPNAPSARLVHPSRTGHPCFLCADNIRLQNPGEVLLPLRLGGRNWWAGANFACIGDNHFTVMAAEHEPQAYRRDLLAAMADLVRQTQGRFRAVFNGLAGASIPEHLHWQACTTPLPVEAMAVANNAVSQPDYPARLTLVEHSDPAELLTLGDECIRDWERRDPKYTENLLLCHDGRRYRLFIFHRHRDKLRCRDRGGALATFEMAGHLVLSLPEDRPLFDTANWRDVAQMLREVSP